MELYKGKNIFIGIETIKKNIYLLLLNIRERYYLKVKKKNIK